MGIYIIREITKRRKINADIGRYVEKFSRISKHTDTHTTRVIWGAYNLHPLLWCKAFVSACSVHTHSVYPFLFGVLLADLTKPIFHFTNAWIAFTILTLSSQNAVTSSENERREKAEIISVAFSQALTSEFSFKWFLLYCILVATSKPIAYRSKNCVFLFLNSFTSLFPNRISATDSLLILKQAWVDFMHKQLKNISNL